jgi:phosphoribosylamine-glycine ligase
LKEAIVAAVARRTGDVLSGLGPTPADASDRAYDAASRISFDGMQVRSDIAARGVERVPSQTNTS